MMALLLNESVWVNTDIDGEKLLKGNTGQTNTH